MSWRFHDEGAWVINTLPHLTCLVGVRSLSLRHAYWGGLRAESNHAFISTFNKITQLSLVDLSFDKFERLVELVCSYPLLEHIHLDDIFWAKKPSLASRSMRVPARLRRLDLGTCPKEVIIEWLSSYHSLYALDTIYLSSVTIQQMRPIALLLRNLGHNLHHLQIEFSSTLEEDSGMPILSTSPLLSARLYYTILLEFFCDIVDLAHNDQLRSIRICDKMHYNLHTGTTILDKVAAVLSQIVSDHIEFVELTIFRDDLIDIAGWSSLANVFAKPQFAALRLINIKGRGRMPQDVMDIVRRGLPDCVARGILNFPS